MSPEYVMEGIFSEDQVLRCIHVGLLCVEDNAVDRPIMSDVLSIYFFGFEETSLPGKCIL